MTIFVYVSMVSASKEIKKRQQRVTMILDSLEIDYEIVDVTEPGHEHEKELMRTVCKKRDSNIALPPQFFNDDQYCGDYEDFDAANDEDKVKVLLKLEEDTGVSLYDLSADKQEVESTS